MRHINARLEMTTSCEYAPGPRHRALKPVPSDTHIDVMHHCRDLSAGVDYSPDTNTGTVILNITCVSQYAADEALRSITAVLASPYAFSNRFVVAGGGLSIGDFKVPARETAIGTVCSLTLNGLLLNRGIQARPKYGGVVEVKSGVPEKFSAFLSSGESLLAPLDDFLNCSMTSVCKTLQTGTGEVLGSFLELPGETLCAAKRLYGQLKPSCMGSKIIFGMLSEPLLGMPVSIGSAGMVVFRDINTVAALAEQGIKQYSPAIKTLFRFERMQSAKP
jgi:HTH-type transcriptional regulator, global nitrogen regulator NrpRI